MRRYQLSGLEHIHMMKRVPRSYDMTRTHIMHRGVNKHVDVVLRCSPKYFKKKKVAVSVVRSDKKTAAARIRANAMRGYVAVRKTVNEQFERDRKAAAEAFEFRYGGRNPGADSLIHDMRSQLAAMAKKSSEYIENQLSHPADGFSAISDLPEGENQPILSHESEEILRRGGYRIPNRQPPEDPYSVEYMTQASDEEFHDLMDSLERSLDEVCRKYSVPPVEEEEPEQPKTPVMPTYSGYSFPNRRSLSVTNKQEITDEPPAEEETVYQYPDNAFNCLWVLAVYAAIFIVIWLAVKKTEKKLLLAFAFFIRFFSTLPDILQHFRLVENKWVSLVISAAILVLVWTAAIFCRKTFIDAEDAVKEETDHQKPEDPGFEA